MTICRLHYHDIPGWQIFWKKEVIVFAVARPGLVSGAKKMNENGADNIVTLFPKVSSFAIVDESFNDNELAVPSGSSLRYSIAARGDVFKQTYRLRKIRWYLTVPGFELDVVKEKMGLSTYFKNQ